MCVWTAKDFEGKEGGGWGGISASASLELPWLSLPSLPEHLEHDEWEQWDESEIKKFTIKIS